MKVAARVFSFLLLASAVIFLSNCKKDDPEASPEQVQLGKLVGSWTMQSATLDGDDRSGDVNGVLVLEGTYAADGGQYNYYFSSATMPSPGLSPWPLKTSASKGTWKFGSDVTTQIVRLDDDPDMQISYNMPSDNQLEMTFVCSSCDFPGGTVPAKIKEISGEWKFTFSK